MSTTLMLRRSALEAFAACPARFKALYQDGIAENADASRRGSTFHRAAELYIKALVTSGERSDPDLARQALETALVEMPVPMTEAGDLDNLWWRWVERFEFNRDAFVAVEAKQVAKLGLTWIPDAVYADTDILTIDDLKTHWHVWSQAQADDSFQAKFYLSQARRAWPGFMVYQLNFQFVRWGVTVTVVKSQGALDEVDAQVDALLAAIQRAERANVWPAMPGAACRTCVVACPLVDQASRLPARVTTPGQAQTAAGELLVLEQAIKARREALRAWTDAEGPVAVGGMEFAHRPVTRRIYPASAVIDLLRDLDEPFPLTFSESALKPLLTYKKWAHVREDIAGLADSKTITEFRAKPVTPEAVEANASGDGNE